MASIRRRMLDGPGRREAPRRPPPSHRHNGPSAPWPWINLHDEIDPLQLASPAPPVPPPCDHTSCDGCWQGYPQSRFPNWTPSQVRRSRIHKAIADYNNDPSIIHYVDVDSNGFFTDSGKFRPKNIRVRALFIEHLTGPVLMMLGATYTLSFPSCSSFNGWIPSRYQEEVRPKQGDRKDSRSPFSFLSAGDHYLILDLLAVHLIRGVDGNTIISYHNADVDTTSATYLHERIRFAGQSVYWQSIFQKSPDPTFVLLTFLWHALYAWDESLELLYSHICYIEAQVINTSDLLLTRELHIIRAHHLHYSALLEDFRKAEERAFSRGLLERECKNLLSEISRLELGRSMQDKRLKNVMNLVFSSQLTEAAMKQIAYLSMVFLPASFVAAIFGMNIRELSKDTRGSLAHYFATALPLTVLTVWVVMTFQSHHLLGKDTTLWMRLFWPVSIARQMIRRRRSAEAYDLDAPNWKD
ncbi:hypothetical protein B0H16DRAFT_1662496 [Mycena metata]|uniref:Uncharacterized protein n=1 Tax=Mycena metata TaxID=1033252 RepID=A0AAD7J8U0_9AGAR|nr:hypothetical protein B0H16DRAFT_1662496 [Mycena metata]